MKKSIKVATLMVALFAGIGTASADESFLSGGITGGAQVGWGTGAVQAAYQGAAGTSSFFGNTIVNLGGSLYGNLVGHGEVLAGSNGAVQAMLAPWSANASVSGGSVVIVDVMHGAGQGSASFSGSAIAAR